VSKGEFINKTTPSSNGAERLYERLAIGLVCDLLYVAFYPSLLVYSLLDAHNIS
jgi:hypothetical protein